MTARLVRFDGRPAAGAVLAIAVVVAIAFAGAFAARASRGGDEPTSTVVPASRLKGEVVAGAERAAAPRLRHAAALPSLAPEATRRRARTRRSARKAVAVETPAATPAATAEPVPTAPPAATAAPLPAPTGPAATPGPTFDSSG